jgi:hypothetical protein
MREEGQGAGDPSRHREPGAPERAAPSPFATDTNSVNSRSTFGEDAAIAAHGGVAPGAGADRQTAAVDAARVRFLAVERELGGHPPEPSILLGKSRLAARNPLH